jgi:putative ABC transport system permease protein
VTASINLGLARYEPGPARNVYEQALERVRALPQVTHAAWSNLVPTRGAFMWNTEIEATGKSLTVYSAHVGPEYFAATGIPISRGRSFEPTDRAGTEPVAIVNERMAREYFPDRDAVGSRIKAFDTWVTVVGVAGDTIVEELREAPAAQLYLAFDQWLEGPRGIGIDTAHLFVKTSGEPEALVPLLRDQLRALDPELPILSVGRFDEAIAQLTMTQRMGVMLFALFSALALALATVGIYGVATYVAALRTREIGVRIALGATRTSVRRLVLREGARPVIAGILVGLALALYTARTARAFLVEVSPVDPVTFVAVTVLLGAVALAASYLPARRASRVEPVVALRDE